MKKIYISADTEGLNGVTSFKQVLPEFSEEYASMRPELHNELNSLIKGLKKGGIKDIVVNDAHNTMTNIILNELPKDVTLISGKPKKVSMMYGLDKSFDGVIFFGYHAMATSEGVLAHTFNMYFKSVWLNGEKIGEAKLNGIYAATIGVPIVLATGDNIFEEEIKKSIGNIKTVQTKTAVSNTAAICKESKKLYDELEKAGKNIKKQEKFSYKLSDNYEMKVELESESMAKEVAKEVSIKADGSFLLFNSADYTEIYTTLQKISAAVTLRKSQNQQV
ncbi:MAG: M55 family metallopeptidase [bacterium]|nr:M55 family metallopeptidase [bacterium]